MIIWKVCGCTGALARRSRAFCSLNAYHAIVYFLEIEKRKKEMNFNPDEMTTINLKKSNRREGNRRAEVLWLRYCKTIILLTIKFQWKSKQKHKESYSYKNIDSDVW
jgi:hypothetical protein